jgi:hypothetical protein
MMKARELTRSSLAGTFWPQVCAFTGFMVMEIGAVEDTQDDIRNRDKTLKYYFSKYTTLGPTCFCIIQPICIR